LTPLTEPTVGGWSGGGGVVSVVAGAGFA